ncbi:hypothetical protein CASFOL_033274 [Castilleja foliolosa]|uniref:Glucosamine/galactosamine-6-phosphate isomerase domain-containing protein n=1 Tax=Castilleja foliolosa TaxID=1961234 RepID=A0ABD3C210_9LAMI
MAEIVTPKSKGKVKVFDTEDDLAVSLAKYAADLADKVLRRADRSPSFSPVALLLNISGEKLVEQPYIDSVDWSKWHIFWVDERVVPKDHPDSNYLLAYNEFLSKDKNEDAAHDDVESLRGKPHSVTDSPINVVALGGCCVDRTKWKRK